MMLLSLLALLPLISATVSGLDVTGATNANGSLSVNGSPVSIPRLFWNWTRTLQHRLSRPQLVYK
jgi:hypothetical protein